MSPEEYERIEVQGESEPQRPHETQSELFEHQVHQEMVQRIHARGKLSPHPFINGVYTFPFYRACFPYALALSLTFLVVGVLVNQLMAFGRELFGW